MLYVQKKNKTNKQKSKTKGKTERNKILQLRTDLTTTETDFSSDKHYSPDLKVNSAQFAKASVINYNNGSFEHFTQPNDDTIQTSDTLGRNLFTG